MYNEQGKDPRGIKDQLWDDSVKEIANYPSVLVKLASDLDWTIALGERARDSGFDREAANQRLNQVRSDPEIQRRAGDMRSNPQIQQRAQSASSAYGQRTRSGGSSAGTGLSSMSRSGSSVNRASARGIASRGSAGGMARGGGRRR